MKYNYYNLLLEDKIKAWELEDNLHFFKPELEYILYSLNDVLSMHIPINCKISPYQEESDTDSIRIFNENFYMEVKKEKKKGIWDDELYRMISSIEFIYKDEKEALHGVKYFTTGGTVSYSEVVFEKDSIAFLNLESMNLKERLENLLNNKNIYPDYHLLASANDVICDIYDCLDVTEESWKWRSSYRGLKKRSYTFENSNTFPNLILGIEQYKNEETKNKVLKKMINNE